MFPVGERGVIFASPYERIHALVGDMDTFVDLNFSHNQLRFQNIYLQRIHEQKQRRKGALPLFPGFED